MIATTDWTQRTHVYLTNKVTVETTATEIDGRFDKITASETTAVFTKAYFPGLGLQETCLSFRDSYVSPSRCTHYYSLLRYLAGDTPETVTAFRQANRRLHELCPA